MEVAGSGVLVRLASEDESRAARRARSGEAFELDRSFNFVEPDGAARLGAAFVVAQAFVELAVDGVTSRWLGSEHHGHQLSNEPGVVDELLELAEDVAREGLMEIRGDLAMDGLRVERWVLLSAPRRIELSHDLKARFARVLGLG
jgi:hypothetical protein